MGIAIFIAAIVGAILYFNMFDRDEREKHWYMAVFAFLVVAGGAFVLGFLYTLVTDGPASAMQMLNVFGDAEPSPYY